MISAAFLFSALPRMWKLGIVAVAVLALVGGLLFIRHQIYMDGFRAAQEACEREKEAQRRANEAAIRKAEADLFKAADRISMKSKELDDALKALDEAAASDPDGHLCGLSARGVSRLQALGNGASPAP